jgi:hypothetical protein
MTEDELIGAFEDGSLPPSAFGHREHVQLAWVYLTRFGPVEAERRMLHGLRALAARAGKPDKFDAPLTRAWVAAIAAADLAHDAHSFDDLVRMRPDLLESRSRLRSLETARELRRSRLSGDESSKA